MSGGWAVNVVSRSLCEFRPPLRCQIFLIFEMFAVACGGLECKRDNKMV